MAIRNGIVPIEELAVVGEYALDNMTSMTSWRSSSGTAPGTSVSNCLTIRKESPDGYGRRTRWRPVTMSGSKSMAGWWRSPTGSASVLQQAIRRRRNHETAGLEFEFLPAKRDQSQCAELGGHTRVDAKA
jgi:hypothetical protein